jgi:hypothetical protein
MMIVVVVMMINVMITMIIYRSVYNVEIDCGDHNGDNDDSFL